MWAGSGFLYFNPIFPNQECIPQPPLWAAPCVEPCEPPQIPVIPTHISCTTSTQNQQVNDIK